MTSAAVQSVLKRRLSFATTGRFMTHIWACCGALADTDTHLHPSERP